MERKRESHDGWESLTEESGYDSVEEKIRRLTERIDELESRERWEGEGQTAKGSSSESDEGNGRWKWDGRAWWCRVEYRARLRRRVSREVNMPLEQESKNWRDGLVQLRDRNGDAKRRAKQNVDQWCFWECSGARFIRE